MGFPAVYYCNIPEYVIKDDILYSADMKTVIVALQSAAGNIVIPEGVRKIRKKAFCGSNIESVEMPNSVKEIECEAFANCLNLKSVKFGSELTNIGREGFRYCDVLDSIDIPAGVKIIEPETFAFCRSLRHVIFHEGLTEVRKEAFFETNLTEITFPESLDKLEKYAFFTCDNADEMVTVKMKHIPQNLIAALTKDNGVSSSECIKVDCEELNRSIFFPAGMRSLDREKYNSEFNAKRESSGRQYLPQVNSGIMLKDSYLNSMYSSGLDNAKQVVVLFRIYKYTKDNYFKKVIMQHTDDFAEILAKVSESIFIEFVSLDCVCINNNKVQKIMDILRNNGRTIAIAYLIQNTQKKAKNEFHI